MDPQKWYADVTEELVRLDESPIGTEARLPSLSADHAQDDVLVVTVVRTGEDVRADDSSEYDNAAVTVQSVGPDGEPLNEATEAHLSNVQAAAQGMAESALLEQMFGGLLNA